MIKISYLAIDSAESL